MTVKSGKGSLDGVSLEDVLFGLGAQFALVGRSPNEVQVGCSDVFEPLTNPLVRLLLLS